MNAPRNGRRSRETTALYSTGTRSTQTATPDLRTPLQFLKGVGPRRAAQLERKGLRTVEDALFFLPLRHEDRTRLVPFRSLQPGQVATCSGTIVGLSPPPPGRSRAPLVVMLRDESGYAQASWFHGAYLARVFERGQRLVLHGKVTRFKGAVVIQQPDYEIVESGDDERLHTGRLVPVYSLTEGLARRALRALLWRIVDTFARDVPEALPDAVRARRKLVTLAQALRDCHFPETDAVLGTARRRLTFDDFLLLQLGLAILRSRTTRARGVAMNPRGQLVARLRGSLPWPLTGAQERVWNEIRRDMAAPFPMHRLLQGDVGCRVGTHALGQEGVEFRRLGLAVVDEQHRFGVEQRARLRGKGEHPDLLVMTATPIPRTLALTLYGDLDVSVLDELPPGRRPVVTVARTASKRREIYAFLRDEIGRGRQPYVVYPLVEASEALDLKAPRARRAGPVEVGVHSPDERPAHRRGQAAHRRDGRDERRLQDRGSRPRAARARRVLRHPAVGTPRVPHRRPAP